MQQKRGKQSSEQESDREVPCREHLAHSVFFKRCVRNGTPFIWHSSAEKKKMNAELRGSQLARGVAGKNF
jgi:hypothetical protein